MIDVVFDSYRDHADPVVLRGDLPVKFHSRVNREWLEINIRLALVLEDELPVFALYTMPETSNHRITPPFAVEVTEHQLSNWLHFARQLQQMTPRTGNLLQNLPAISRDPTSQGLLGTYQLIRVWMDPFSHGIHLQSEATDGRIIITDEHTRQWGDDLVQAFTVMEEILHFVRKVRSARREEVMTHVSNLLMTSIL